MELKDYVYGSLTLVILTVLGFQVLETDTHFCRESGIAMKCDRLSSTGSTCYPYPSIRTGSKFCSSGWELIKATETIPEPVKISGGNSGRYTCTSEGCVN